MHFIIRMLLYDQRKICAEMLREEIWKLGRNEIVKALWTKGLNFNPKAMFHSGERYIDGKCYIADKNNIKLRQSHGDSKRQVAAVCLFLWRGSEWISRAQRFLIGNTFQCHWKYSLWSGKGEFSLQSQRKEMPTNAQTTTQLHSSHMLIK